MKLKRVQKSNDDWLHCCKYCKHYKDGECQRNLQSIDDSIIYQVSESGYVSQTIEQVLNNERLVRQFMYSIESIFDKWNISQKKKAEFEEHFKECWSEFADMELKDELDEKILECYIRNSGINEIRNLEMHKPLEFVCAYWE